MAEVTLRQVYGDEMLDIVHWMHGYALRPSPPLIDKAEYQAMVKQRKGVVYFALYEDGEPVACVASTPLVQQVRGGLFGAGGIMEVVTHPAARRKGYSRRLMARLLDAIRQEGRPLSCLYPFRESFYERLGYVTFSQIRKASFAPSTLAPLLKVDLGGEVELALIGERYEVYLDYLRQVQRRVHGMALFEHADHGWAQRNRFWLALARVKEKTVGLMLYALRGERETEYNLRAFRFYYHTSQGKYLLLQWVARHIDQANQAELWLSPLELPETWLADMNVTVETVHFTPMGRVVDLAQMGGVHTGSGRFSARVQDPLCPWNEGVWRFETADGRLQVYPAQEADCALSIQAVSALVYGAHDPADFS
ncbi:MAG: GNAT family N-acetyltransferase, partial [Anaerolineae bacterium]